MRFFYVLDGQQRLTSLLLPIRKWNIRREGRELSLKRPISYNLTERKFVLGEGGVNLSTLLRAFALRDPKAMLDLSHAYEKHWSTLSELFRRISDYRIPVYIIETEAEEEEEGAPRVGEALAEAFVRINKSGTRIGNFELLVSLAAGCIGPTASKVWDVHYRLRRRYGLNLGPILRLFCRALGLKQTDVARIPLMALRSK